MDTTVNDSNADGKFSNNATKKADKKVVRALAILRKDTNICESSGGVSRTLFVCNAGLVTGCSQPDLLNVFTKLGPVLQIVLIPGKSYSFVVFKDSDVAERAYRTVHGKVGLSDKGPLYLAYVDSAPKVDDPWRDPQLPDGLHVIPDYVTEMEEKELLDTFDWGDSNRQENVLKHRQVKHFGFEFNYSTNDIDPDLPLDDKIPESCQRIAERALSDGHIDVVADQLTVNRYLPGQGIPPHVDSHNCCTHTILSLSLGSGAIMTMRCVTSGVSAPVWLPRRSLLVMRGPARYCWSHGITPRHYDTLPCHVIGQQGEGLTLVDRDVRVSLTFRRTFRGQCNCNYPAHCDRNKLENERTKAKISHRLSQDIEQTASLLEKQLVHSVYEEIAGHFSDTRHKPWPRVVTFLESVERDGLLLDLGCGNGKYLGLGSGEDGGRWELGTDYSFNLLQISSGRGHQAVRCDMLSVPLRDNVCSGVICIAVLHHLATPARRLAALKEVARILRPGGRALLYVWAKEQHKNNDMSSYLKQNKKNFKQKNEAGIKSSEVGEFGLPVHVNRTQFQHQDVLVPWKTKQEDGAQDKEWKRFYHVFEEGELENLIREAGDLSIVESYYDQGNWCCIFEKISPCI